MRDVRWCEVNHSWCDCSPRCGEAAPTYAGMVFHSTCEHCQVKSERYEMFPTCRDCSAMVCPSCSTDHDPETGRATCLECVALENIATGTATRAPCDLAQHVLDTATAMNRAVAAQVREPMKPGPEPTKCPECGSLDCGPIRCRFNLKRRV